MVFLRLSAWIQTALYWFSHYVYTNIIEAKFIEEISHLYRFVIHMWLSHSRVRLSIFFQIFQSWIKNTFSAVSKYRFTTRCHSLHCRCNPGRFSTALLKKIHLDYENKLINQLVFRTTKKWHEIRFYTVANLWFFFL